MLTAVIFVSLTAPSQTYCPPPRGYGCNGGAYLPPAPRPRGRALDFSFEDGASRLQLRLGPRDDNGYGPAPGVRERRGVEDEGELEYRGPAPAENNGGGQFVSTRGRSRAAVCAERRRVFASSYRAGYYPAYFRP